MKIIHLIPGNLSGRCKRKFCSCLAKSSLKERVTGIEVTAENKTHQKQGKFSCARSTDGSKGMKKKEKPFFTEVVCVSQNTQEAGKSMLSSKSVGAVKKCKEVGFHVYEGFSYVDIYYQNKAYKRSIGISMQNTRV